MKRLLATVSALLLGAGSVAADPPEGRTEISIVLGVSLLDVARERTTPLPPFVDQLAGPFARLLEFRERRRLGGSALLGFKVGRYLGDRALLEAALVVGPSHDLRTESSLACAVEDICRRAGLPPSGRPPLFETQANVAAYHYDLNLAYDLTRGEVRPFLTFGAGGVSSDAGERVETDFAFNFGAGAKLYFGKVGARFEVGDHVVTDHFLSGKAEHDVQLRGGLVFRLP